VAHVGGRTLRTSRRRRSWLGDLIAGAAYLPRGLHWVAARPGLWSLGVVPAIITAAALGVALLVLLFSLGELTAWLTPFAGTWSATARDLVRALLAVALVAGAVWLAAVSFTALALAIGQPFYERISERVERELGPVPGAPAGAPGWALGRAARDAVATLGLSAGCGLLLFALGFVPLIGQTLVPVTGACVAGFWLACELTSPAFERRGRRLGTRIGLLRRRWPLAVGFGTLTFLLFLVPLMAVVAMPGAVAGGTLLVREQLDSS
jgi:CysZ protein